MTLFVQHVLDLPPIMGVGMLMVSVAVLAVCLQRKHVLCCLVALEFMLLGLFCMMVSISVVTNEGCLLFILLTFGVCEAAMGLALLVVMVRTHGNDHVRSLSTLKC